jgi:hypothetical protein
MHIDDVLIKSYLLENPFRVHHQLQAFGTQRTIQNCIAFPFNSPLRHMFAKAIQQARGAIQQLLSIILKL